MKECRECELAIYCFSDSSTWIFRTKQEMEEKRIAIDSCPVGRQARQAEGESAKATSGLGQV